MRIYLYLNNQLSFYLKNSILEIKRRLTYYMLAFASVTIVVLLISI